MVEITKYLFLLFINTFLLFHNEIIENVLEALAESDLGGEFVYKFGGSQVPLALHCCVHRSELYFFEYFIIVVIILNRHLLSSTIYFK
jgi:hypothetical protein